MQGSLRLSAIDSNDNLKDPMTMDGSNLFGFQGANLKAGGLEEKSTVKKVAKMKSEGLGRQEYDKGTQGEAGAIYGSDAKAKLTEKKKQVETPAFGKKEKGFFRDTQASPVKVVSQFSLSVPTKREVPSSSKANQKKNLSKSATTGNDSVHSSKKSLQTIQINSATSSKQSLANPTNVSSTKRVMAEKLKNKRQQHGSGKQVIQNTLNLDLNKTYSAFVEKSLGPNSFFTQDKFGSGKPTSAVSSKSPNISRNSQQQNMQLPVTTGVGFSPNMAMYGHLTSRSQQNESQVPRTVAEKFREYKQQQSSRQTSQSSHGKSESHLYTASTLTQFNLNPTPSGSQKNKSARGKTTGGKQAKTEYSSTITEQLLQRMSDKQPQRQEKTAMNKREQDVMRQAQYLAGQPVQSSLMSSGVSAANVQANLKVPQIQLGYLKQHQNQNPSISQSARQHQQATLSQLLVPQSNRRPGSSHSQHSQGSSRSKKQIRK